MPTTVYISLYHPSDQRDPSHWAIYLQNSKGGVILQVVDDKGGVGYYVDEPLYNKEPQSSRRHDISIEVGTIKDKDHKTAVETIQATPVDNESTTWNCQAWAVDALDGLEGAGLFKWDTKGREQVLKRRQHWQ